MKEPRSLTSALLAGARYALPALLASLTLATPPAAQSPPPPPTKTAVGTPTDFPDATTGKFEKSSISTHQYAPAWAPWTFQPLMYGIPPGGGPTFVSGSGIAHNNSPLLSGSADAPQGRRVAFLHGLGSATTSFTFQPGTWRLRFFAAQRVQSGVPDQQVLRVTIGASTVFEQELEDGTYREYLTEPVRVTCA